MKDDQVLWGVVTLFNYLGRTLSSSEINSPAAEQNLQNAQGKWGRQAMIVGSEGADRRMMGRFYV